MVIRDIISEDQTARIPAKLNEKVNLSTGGFPNFTGVEMHEIIDYGLKDIELSEGDMTKMQQKI